MHVKSIVRNAAILVTLVCSVGLASLFFRPDVRPHPRYLLEYVGLRETAQVRAQRQTVLIRTETGQGSGVLIRRVDETGSPKWFVWTAAHVVDDTDTPKVVVFVKNDYSRVGETIFSGKVIARDDAIDLALLWVDMPDGYGVSAEFESVIPQSPGTAVYHVGNFWGQSLFNSVSSGVVSEVGLTPGEGFPWPIADQTTTMIHPGSSGGPLFKQTDNKVVGLTVGIRGSVGFYVPTRALSMFALSKRMGWAVEKAQCPNRSRLEALAAIAKMEHVKLPPVIVFPIGLDIP